MPFFEIQWRNNIAPKISTKSTGVPDTKTTLSQNTNSEIILPGSIKTSTNKSPVIITHSIGPLESSVTYPEIQSDSELSEEIRNILNKGNCLKFAIPVAS